MEPQTITTAVYCHLLRRLDYCPVWLALLAWSGEPVASLVPAPAPTMPGLEMVHIPVELTQNRL